MPAERQARSISGALLFNPESKGTYRLRYLLAEEGCKESQISLAKSLLSEPIHNSDDRHHNAQLAVHWLLKAAHKGHQEAFVLLDECVTQGIGINVGNCVEVYKCLKFSEKEIISRRVAFGIFHAIMGDTEEPIPEEVFQTKIEHILKKDIEEIDSTEINEDSVPQDNIEEVSLKSQHQVSFSEVVNSVHSCLEGNLPLLSLKKVAQYDDYRKWIFSRYGYTAWNLILRSLEDLVQNLASSALLSAMLIMLIVLKCAAFALTPGSEMSMIIDKYRFFPITTLCLLAMLYSTCSVICIGFGSDNVKKWLDLIKFFEPNVKSDEINQKFLSKTIIPLLTCLLLTAVYVILLPLSHMQIAFTDLGILSVFLMVLVDRTIIHKRYYVNVSLLINVLACLHKAGILQKWLSSFLDFLNLNIIYEIDHYQFHLNFVTCLTLPFVLPYLYTKIALGNERKGWYLILLPHLVSVTWMNLAFIHFSDSNTSDIINKLFSWSIVLLISRYLGVILSFSLYFFIRMFYTTYISTEIVFLSMVVFMICLILSILLSKKFKVAKSNGVWNIVICAIILALFYQETVPKVAKVNDSSEILPWEKYQSHCHQNAWYRTNTIQVQISCLPLKGKRVSIKGTVISLDVIEIYNPLNRVISVLPNPFHDWFTCLFGKHYTNCNEGESQIEKEHCLLHDIFNYSDCHIHNWDKYKYQITLEVSSRISPEVVLIVDNICSSFVKNLKEGDALHVIGILDGNIGSLSPRFLLQEGSCDNCYSDDVCNTVFTKFSNIDYSLSLQYFISLYFAPFIYYVPKK